MNKWNYFSNIFENKVSLSQMISCKNKRERERERERGGERNWQEKDSVANGRWKTGIDWKSQTRSRIFVCLPVGNASICTTAFARQSSNPQSSSWKVANLAPRWLKLKTKRTYMITAGFFFFLFANENNTLRENNYFHPCHI